MDLPLQFPPRISPAQAVRIFTRTAAPAAAIAAAPAMHAAIASQGLDPAVGFAFALKEHSGRWLGVAGHTKGLANVTVGALACVGERSRRIGAYKRFAKYASYEDGAWDWAAYMRCRFLDRGILDLRAILDEYAPEYDGNDPAAYTAFVREHVTAWAEEDRHMAGQPMLVIGDGTRVRAGHSLDAKILLQLRAASRVLVDQVVEGTGLDDAPLKWARIVEPIEGYIALYLLREVSR